MCSGAEAAKASKFGENEGGGMVGGQPTVARKQGEASSPPNNGLA